MKKHRFHHFQEATSNFLEPVTPPDNYARRIVLITGARRFLARVVQTQLKRLSRAAIGIRRGVDEKDRTRDRAAARLDASGSPSLSLSLCRRFFSLDALKNGRASISDLRARHRRRRGREWERFWCLRIHTYLRETVTTRPFVVEVLEGEEGDERERERERAGEREARLRKRETGNGGSGEGKLGQCRGTWKLRFRNARTAPPTAISKSLKLRLRVGGGR